MDPEDISSLINSLKISNEESSQVVVLGDDLRERNAASLRLCLSCKVMASKAINRELFRGQIPKILQLKHKVEIELIGPNIFVLEFKSMADRRRILNGGPWDLFKNSLVFTEIDEGTNVTDLQFDSIPMWIQFHNVPLACFNKGCAELFGEQVGSVLEVDENADGCCWGRYLRVRVSVRLDKPLTRLIRLQVKANSEPITLLVSYERLVSHCFRCGLIGHLVKFCVQEGSVGADEGEYLPYGPWLRAGSMSGKAGIPSRSPETGNTRPETAPQTETIQLLDQVTASRRGESSSDMHERNGHNGDSGVLNRTCEQLVLPTHPMVTDNVEGLLPQSPCLLPTQQADATCVVENVLPVHKKIASTDFKGGKTQFPLTDPLSPTSVALENKQEKTLRATSEKLAPAALEESFANGPGIQDNGYNRAKEFDSLRVWKRLGRGQTMEGMQFNISGTPGISGACKRGFHELEVEGDVSAPNPAKKILVASTDNEEISASLARPGRRQP